MFNTTFLSALRQGAILAPMAGVTDMPFRRICLEMGAVYAVTEMVSAKGFLMSGEKLRTARELLHVDASEQGKVALQLFGHEQNVMAEAAARLSRTGRYFMIDLNMGCPVPKVCRNGEGSALMQSPEVAYGIMVAVVAASAVPVSVKMRLGYADDRDAFLTLADLAQKAGISLITLHARTRAQYYEGSADWTRIRALKKACQLPVIGNGDITDADSARRMIAETGCDGIAVGRAAEGNPFIFREICGALQGRMVPPPTIAEREQVLLRHARELAAFKGETVGVREMRRHVVNYVHGLRGATTVRRRINTVTTLPVLEDVIHSFFTGFDPADIG